MANEGGVNSARSRLSLYADLLDSPTSTGVTHGTISGAPVLYQQPSSSEERMTVNNEKHRNAASLRFQPTKRPQLSNAKLKSKLPSSKVPLAASTPGALKDEQISDPAAISKATTTKSTLADWTAGADGNNVNDFYQSEKRQRGGKKRRKKNREEAAVIHNWDDIYDPTRPNNYEDYYNSDEKIAEIKEWKDRLYAHRTARRHSSHSGSSCQGDDKDQLNRSFAPPPSFAPPTSYDDDKDDAHLRKTSLSPTTAPPHGEDNSSREDAPSQTDLQASTSSYSAIGSLASQSMEPAKSIQASKNPLTISRAPVRYNLPAAPGDIPATEAELTDALDHDEEDALIDKAPRSLRPGQHGFAERLMSKYGWSKGSGLGASGSGIVNPLSVKLEKQKKKPDAEGGGFAGPGGMGKIVGGKAGSGGMNGEVGKFGMMSEVILLKGMVDGMDLEAELGNSDGGLMQEIGEECGEKYGRVERVFIDRSDTDTAPVFVKFTSQLSALRAVNALEGRIFNGNKIKAMFFDKDQFEQGEYK